MNKMAIAYFGSFGASYLPPSLTLSEGNIVEQRATLAKDLMEGDNIIEIGEFQGLPPKEEADRNKIYLMKGKYKVKRFYFISDRFGELHYSKINVEEVDTSRKWAIDDYDGVESIVYFEEIQDNCFVTAHR